MKKTKPGTVAPNRIPIISRTGHVVGNVGSKATTATVSRFLGHPRARLTKYQGRTSWVETGTNGRGDTYQRPRRPAADRKHSLGSVKS